MKAIWIIGVQGLRGARGDFWIFALAILLSVAMATGVATLTSGLRAGVDRESRQMLAADLRLESTAPLPEALRSRLTRPDWRVVENLEFNAMMRNPATGASLLVEVLAAASGHPLRGEVELASGIPLAEALRGDGAVAEGVVLERLGMRPGARFELGRAKLRLADRLAREPDRVVRFFRWGPRLIIPLEQVNNTGLLGFGSRVTHVTLIRLPEGGDPAVVARELTEETLGTGIRVMTPNDGQMSARRFIDRFTLFMRLLTLLTLLSTGNAMAGAMAAHARESRRQVAILQALGVGHGTILGIFMLRILLVALPSALVGALSGSGWPLLFDFLGMDAGVTTGFSTTIFLSGVVGGLLGSLLFSFGALWSLRSVSPLGLFRAVAWSGGGEYLRARWRWGVPFGLVLLAALAVGAQDGWKAALLLVAGLSGALLVLTLLGRAMLWLLGKVQPASLAWRLSLRGLTAHGNGTLGSLVSLGLGMATLATMLFLERNIDRQLTERLPDRVASFFLLDLQPDQEAPLREMAGRYLHQADDLRVTPVVRGRLRALNGAEVTGAVAASHPQAWRFQRDYVLTWAGEPPAGNRIIQGRWWSDPNAREVSLEREMARDLRLGLGDAITFSILGVDVTATVTSIRELSWSDMSLNFFVIFAPGVVEGVPFSHLASIRLDPDREEPFRAEVTQRLNNISLIAAREVMERAREMLERLIGSLRLAGGMAVVAGVIALLVAILLLERGRVREAAIARLLGARQRDLRQVAWREFLILGICASGVGVIVGQGIAWAVIRFLLQDRWDWLPGITVVTLTGGALLVAGTGFLAARRDLERPILEALRARED
ncbi:hypothetical protein SIID45300_01318 [Candidatus Magnetaquicoccaceae bacterium FCR-1]|uniref:ABC3 transporter permease C-terminal domain-containing protein n=1 Tax=Candidatus Magnetaquiglobus chichijimensis TaxID=3141448 RepID=A0ABQ0C7Y0_9PROT